MTAQKEKIWPYSTLWAALAIPLTWILFGVLISLTTHYAGWPDEKSNNLVITVAVAFSLIPLGLVLLDFLVRSKTKLDTPWVKLDFSHIDLSKPDIKRETPGIPDNIGESGPIITDTAQMSILKALQEIAKDEFAVISIRDGNAWWVTRLLALAAGAVRKGTPKAFVFTGKQANVPDCFLGWAKPTEILEAILNDNDQYRIRYKKSMLIARQVVMYANTELVPDGLALTSDILRYTGRPDYVQLGEAVTEQIIMDQLGITYGYGAESHSLESPPDKLNLARVRNLFDPLLNKNFIDLNWENKKQIEHLLQSKTPYLALTRDGRYDSMLKREDGERLILKTLFEQSQEENKNANN